MPSIFISYRRGQSASDARALFGELVRRFGDDRVFMDVDDIRLGHDFRTVLQDQLARSDVLLVVMGPEWADARDSQGERRIVQAGDYVRMEVATALQRKMQVIPVLVQGAFPPAADRLPPDLAALSYLQGIRLDHAMWKESIDRLTAGFERTGGSQTAPAPAPASVAIAPGAAAEGSVAPVFDDLGSDDPSKVRRAIRCLRGDLLGSEEAVAEALDRLPPLRWFPMKTYEGRAELVSFLIRARAEAWSPALIARAKFLVRDMLARLDAGTLRIKPESRELLEQLAVRLQQVGRPPGG